MMLRPVWGILNVRRTSVQDVVKFSSEAHKRSRKHRSGDKTMEVDDIAHASKWRKVARPRLQIVQDRQEEETWDEMEKEGQISAEANS